MGKMKRLIVAGVILAVIVVMALRGCPRMRRSVGIAPASPKAGVTGIAMMISQRRTGTEIRI
jgi:hypothetical protein